MHESPRRTDARNSNGVRRLGAALHSTSFRPGRWGIILAGGDGTRLLPLTRRMTGDDRPKQFCSVLGGDTLLQQTQRRVGQIVRVHQTLLVLTKKHEPFYKDQVSDLPPSHLVIQPQNQGTAVAILYSLLRLEELDPSGVVAFFPSDHHFENDDALANHINSAFAAAESQPDLVILLGIAPETPEVEYGWIQPGGRVDHHLPDALMHVNRFWEKPAPALASALMDQGCLWNSFVMVGRIGAFLKLIRRNLVSLAEAFEALRPSLLTASEPAAVRALYSAVPPSNFSTEVLSTSASNLAVLRTHGLGWSDLGEPGRVLSVVRRKETRPARDFEPPIAGKCAKAKAVGG